MQFVDVTWLKGTVEHDPVKSDESGPVKLLLVSLEPDKQDAARPIKSFRLIQVV